MTYNVQLSPHAAKQYRKFDPPIKAQVQAAIDSLQHTPASGSKIDRLKGRLHAYYRYRTGDYRILYVIDHASRSVYIDYIQHRRDVYRDLE